MDDRTKWVLVGGLFCLWIVLLAIRLTTESEPQRAPLKFKTGQRVARAATSDTTGVPKVVRPPQMKPLDPPVLQHPNIFAPLGAEPDAPAVQPRVAKATTTPWRPKAVVTKEMFGPERPLVAVSPPPPPPGPSPDELAVQQARQRLEQAAQQARQRLAQYRFLGYLTEGGEHRAFLGKGRELYIVRTGEMVEGRIRVSAIDASSVKLTDGDTGVGTTLPLVKESGGPS
jgi:hypothetical protein